MKDKTYKDVSDEDFKSLLGEGIHTGLRKGTDAPGAHDLWVSISNSGQAWSGAVAYAVWGLKYMGYKLVEEEK